MAANLAPGDVILGKYRVERVIGQGGMGIVVAARHTALGELFAIKLMLNVDGAGGKQAFDRFLREARICASLKGEHVVKVQDVGELDDGRPYMVMEYLEGQDLGSVLEKQGPLSVNNAAAIVLQACEALAEAHRLGIVHRDVKPPNMFLIRTPSGKLRLKLLDFGISKRTNAETKALTATGAMMGSPLYMSPEQLTDARAVGPSTDIWAMGVVLYELVTNKVPFDGEMIFQVIQEILNKTPDIPSKHRPSLPVEVDKIVMRALHKDPTKRYASIDEFARDVRQLLQANSVISSSFDLSGSSEPEVNIDIQAATLDAASFGPTMEASIEHQPSGSIDVVMTLAEADPAKVSTNGSVGAKSGAGQDITPSRAASTHSDLTKSVPEVGSAKAMSPVALAIGAVVLLAIGGGVVYLVQNGSRASTSEAVTTAVANTPSAPTRAPAPTVVNDSAPATSAVPLEPMPSSTAPTTTTSADAVALGKTKPWPSAKSATKIPTAPSAPKREGLF